MQTTDERDLLQQYSSYMDNLCLYTPWCDFGELRKHFFEYMDRNLTYSIGCAPALQVVVSPTGGNGTACTVADPCSIEFVASTVVGIAAGFNIILMPGTYRLHHSLVFEEGTFSLFPEYMLANSTTTKEQFEKDPIIFDCNGYSLSTLMSLEGVIGVYDMTFVNCYSWISIFFSSFRVVLQYVNFMNLTTSGIVHSTDTLIMNNVTFQNVTCLGRFAITVVPGGLFYSNVRFIDSTASNFIVVTGSIQGSNMLISNSSLENKLMVSTAARVFLNNLELNHFRVKLYDGVGTIHSEDAIFTNNILVNNSHAPIFFSSALRFEADGFVFVNSIFTDSVVTSVHTKVTRATFRNYTSEYDAEDVKGAVLTCWKTDIENCVVSITDGLVVHAGFPHIVQAYSVLLDNVLIRGVDFCVNFIYAAKDVHLKDVQFENIYRNENCVEGCFVFSQSGITANNIRIYDSLVPRKTRSFFWLCSRDIVLHKVEMRKVVGSLVLSSKVQLHNAKIECLDEDEEREMLSGHHLVIFSKLANVTRTDIRNCRKSLFYGHDNPLDYTKKRFNYNNDENNNKKKDRNFAYLPLASASLVSDTPEKHVYRLPSSLPEKGNSSVPFLYLAHVELVGNTALKGTILLVDATKGGVPVGKIGLRMHNVIIRDNIALDRGVLYYQLGDKNITLDYAYHNVTTINNTDSCNSQHFANENYEITAIGFDLPDNNTMPLHNSYDIDFYLVDGFKNIVCQNVSYGIFLEVLGEKPDPVTGGMSAADRRGEKVVLKSPDFVQGMSKVIDLWMRLVPNQFHRVSITVYDTYSTPYSRVFRAASDCGYYVMQRWKPDDDVDLSVVCENPCTTLAYKKNGCGGVQNTYCHFDGQVRSCSCRLGYLGPPPIYNISSSENPFNGTCTDRIMCTNTTDMCGNVPNSECKDTGVNRRTCSCTFGYSGTPPITDIADDENPFKGPCRDADRCEELGGGSKACGNIPNTECKNLHGPGRLCSCKLGYAGMPVTYVLDNDNSPNLGSNYTCTDFDPCNTTNICGKFGICENTGVNTRKCSCPPSYGKKPKYNIADADPYEEDCIGGSDRLPTAVTLSIGLLVLFLGAAFGFWYYRRKTLDKFRILPKQIRGHYMEAQSLFSGNGWTTVGDSPKLYVKLLTKSKDREFAVNVLKLMEGGSLNIKNVYAVCNPMLITAFSVTLQKLTARVNTSPELFYSEKWKLGKKRNAERRKAVKRKMEERMKLFSWNENRDVPILPLIHGSSLETAWKICQNGFATLSIIDAGWYGSGIYFTTYALYAIPYFANHPEPAIILSYGILGNAYPVIEHPNNNAEEDEYTELISQKQQQQQQQPQSTFVGAPLRAGYQSHYIATNQDGLPASEKDLAGVYNKTYDEVVVNQEAQICPAYIFELEDTNFDALCKQFMREVPDVSNARELEEFIASDTEGEQHLLHSIHMG